VIKAEEWVPEPRPGGDAAARVAGRRSATRGSCSAQQEGSARASFVRVRSAGAVLSSSADTIRGETKASDAKSRMCRSAFPSRRAIMAKLAARPESENLHMLGICGHLSQNLIRPGGWVKSAAKKITTSDSCGASRRYARSDRGD